jgi:hypothetical protein
MNKKPEEILPKFISPPPKKAFVEIAPQSSRSVFQGQNSVFLCSDRYNKTAFFGIGSVIWWMSASAFFFAFRTSLVFAPIGSD